MKTWHLTTVALALAAAFPTPLLAQTNAELLNELKALRDRINQIEHKLKAVESAKPPAGAPAGAQWGMTPEQVQELNRVTVKAEATEDNIEAWGLKGLTVSGQMEPTFIYNRAQNRSGFQFLNLASDDGYNYDNSYFGIALLDFQKETESGSRWRLTLAPSRGAGSVADGSSIVHEATVSVPITDLQTRFMAGQMPDWSGYEYLQPTLNKLITHNLLFDMTLPTTYTGAGLDITRGKWWYRAMVANMNATKNAGGEKSTVLSYRVDYSRGEFQGFGFAGVHGKAANLVNGGPDTSLNLFQADAYFIRGDVTAQAQVSVGGQKHAAITADPNTGDLRDSRWWGLSGLAAYKITPRFEGVTRMDYINNKKNGGGLLGYGADSRNGVGPDATLDCATAYVPGCDDGANRMALSFGVNYLYNLHTILKAEYRLDRANLPVFEDVKNGGFRKSNHLLGASMVVSF